MKKAPTSPLDMLSANLAYFQRLTDLAQQSSSRWLALGQQMAGASASHLSTLGPLSPTDNWQEIAPALGDVARARWQCALNATHALSQAVLEEQNAWTAGTSEATSNWLRDAAGASNGLGTESVTKMWSALAEQWNSACKGLSGLAQTGNERNKG